MLGVRKTYPDLMAVGEFELWDENVLHTFTCAKSTKQMGRMLCCFLNFSDEEQPISWPVTFRMEEAELLISNVQEQGRYLSSWESRVYLVS